MALDDPPDAVTADEWLAAQAEAVRDEDAWRRVTPAHLAGESDADAAVVEPDSDTHDAAASGLAGRDDQKPAATVEPVELPDRIPSLAETAAQVLRAQEALARLADRRDAEARRQADEDTLLALALADHGRERGHPTHHRKEDDLVLERV